MDTENIKRNAAVILAGMFSRHGSNSTGMTDEAVRIAFEIERLVEAKVSDSFRDGMPRPSVERQSLYQDMHDEATARRTTVAAPSLTERKVGKAPELAMGYGAEQPNSVAHEIARQRTTPEEMASRFAKDD